MPETEEAKTFSPDLIDVLNGIPHGIVIVDQNLRIIVMNRFLEALTGYSGEEARGIYCDHVLHSSFGRNGQIFRQAAETGVSCSVEGDILGLNRKKIPMRFTATPVVAPGEGGQALVLVLEDIADCQKTAG